MEELASILSANEEQLSNSRAAAVYSPNMHAKLTFSGGLGISQGLSAA
jgi:hypothetical protein